MTSAQESSIYDQVERDDDVVRVLGTDGSLDSQHDPGLSAEEAVHLYRHMLLTRMIDERLVTLQRQGRIGFHIGSLGEEAAIIGSAYAMRKQDWLFPCYREFGAALLRGMPLQRYVDNMFGNANDPVKGRQMPDHYTCKAAQFGSVSSPIGTQITQAVGFAWAAKIQKKDLVTLAYFGEGATSSNEFHNGLNFAGVFKTPTVFLCRNNGWAISVPTERQTATRTFAEKGIAYGIPSLRVDGNDLFAVIAVTRDAVRRASQGEGPTLIEAITYRMGGHSTSDDPTRYRDKTLLDPWHERDPLTRIKRYLDKQGLFTDAEEQKLKAEIDARLKDAVEIAEKTPAPALESLFEDVYEKLSWNLREQRDELLAGPRAPSAHH
ncbi:MAG: pyruvate dehydrogenase (acetyl-transferring) E1 component subunit alpha [Polyangiaceae bacterium]|nr:pyruvate dehydrogenase (acetyl-transferring) E1 component subunit alpha [Polyangiaceae bacterium]MCE7891360.1 pyruvate dehydrogenase (acetyl-transferring) E1 component subunit alpha [Sorangiineae bacterium PRO1]MCL4749282.1 pyruvate dehydrogenase (acetyl-transferring) E1 component subunit alpha [Myxococcales bacterium]